MSFEDDVLQQIDASGNPEEVSTAEDASHREAVEFFERNRDFFEHYARGRVKIAPAPKGLDTFAFNLQDNTIYVNSKFYDSIGFAEAQTTFATLHELEHFFEKKQILREKGGEKIFERYLRRIKESGAYSLMDNHMADVRENSAINKKTNDSFATVEDDLYKNNFFKDKDLTSEPRHVQFSYALHELRGLGDDYIVDPLVREKLDELKAITAKDGTKLVDIIADPETSMSMRLRLQDRFIWPMVNDLLNKDMEDEKKKKVDKKDDGVDGKEQDKSEPNEPKDGKQDDKKGNGEGETDPNEVFKEAYERASKRVPNAVPISEIEKALKEWKENNRENPMEEADRQYAERIGVKKEDLQRYRRIVEELRKIRNVETNETIIEELRTLIERIIAKRLKPKHAPRYPVEEGEELTDPAQLVADAKALNFEPKVWETLEVKQRPGQRFGEVEITLICDRSSSMQEGNKLTEQRKATVFLMEALKEFADRAEEEFINLEKPLEVRSEVYAFQGSGEDSVPLKKMSKELGEKERIDVMVKISSAPGGTTDFIPLEKIRDAIDEEILRKIEDGELKKVVIVFTDGESNDSSRVQRVLKELRNTGSIVVGVGITEEGRPALTTYAPGAQLAEQAERLSAILADVLKDSLSDV